MPSILTLVGIGIVALSFGISRHILSSARKFHKEAISDFQEASKKLLEAGECYKAANEFYETARKKYQEADKFVKALNEFCAFIRKFWLLREAGGVEALHTPEGQEIVRVLIKLARQWSLDCDVEGFIADLSKYLL